ncbi:MAG: ferredoxin--NADP+ reductase [Planctomycetaceae bacterium]|jgi:ferredoxin--NADP+ reductase
MTGISTLDIEPSAIRLLRERHYNATLVGLHTVHDELRILMVQPDGRASVSFEPGEYTVLGLGNWEPRVDGAAGDLAEDAEHPESGFDERLTKRAYSFSSSLIDEHGRLVFPTGQPFAEFYITRVPNSSGHVPLLTPRLFALNPGDRLFLGAKATGHYSLRHVRPEDNVVHIATGTGEAPHNAMIAWLLCSGHRGHIAAVTCVREKRDLGYLAAHRRIEQQFTKYRYVTLTTREPENLDPSVPGYVGKRYLQEMLTSGELEREVGFDIEPTGIHVFLCGNPAMLGVPKDDESGVPRYPEPTGMVELLTKRGFTIETPHSAGNLHFEKYW